MCACCHCILLLPLGPRSRKCVWGGGVGVYAHPGKHNIYNYICICPSICFQIVKPQWAGSSTATSEAHSILLSFLLEISFSNSKNPVFIICKRHTGSSSPSVYSTDYIFSLCQLVSGSEVRGSLPAPCWGFSRSEHL